MSIKQVNRRSGKGAPWGKLLGAPVAAALAGIGYSELFVPRTAAAPGDRGRAPRNPMVAPGCSASTAPGRAARCC
ncbi:MAG: hypothetical protein OHK0022_29740 [Roseiflexaceae bacterium]